MDNMAPVIDDDDVEELRQMTLQLIQAEKFEVEARLPGHDAHLASPPPVLGDAHAQQVRRLAWDVMKNSPPPQFLVHKRHLAP
jgi:hypothetical protein